MEQWLAYRVMRNLQSTHSENYIDFSGAFSLLHSAHELLEDNNTGFIIIR